MYFWLLGVQSNPEVVQCISNIFFIYKNVVSQRSLVVEQKWPRKLIWSSVVDQITLSHCHLLFLPTCIVVLAVNMQGLDRLGSTKLTNVLTQITLIHVFTSILASGVRKAIYKRMRGYYIIRQAGILPAGLRSSWASCLTLKPSHVFGVKLMRRDTMLRGREIWWIIKHNPPASLAKTMFMGVSWNQTIVSFVWKCGTTGTSTATSLASAPITRISVMLRLCH